MKQVDPYPLFCVASDFSFAKRDKQNQKNMTPLEKIRMCFEFKKINTKNDTNYSFSYFFAYFQNLSQTGRLFSLLITNGILRRRRKWNRKKKPSIFSEPFELSFAERKRKVEKQQNYKHSKRKNKICLQFRERNTRNKIN